ncbi:MAG: acetolactate synthase small subunit [Hyphomicrobiales bacterium]
MLQEKHVMTMLVDNEPGVVSRVAGLFSGKGFNIESICGSPTNDPQVSRITIVTQANAPLVEQIEKQLRKLVNVIKLRSLNGPLCVRRELALACVQIKPEQRAEVLRIVDLFNGKVADAGLSHLIVEVSGEQEEVQTVLNLLKPFGIKKLARTGPIGLIREPK